MAGATALAGRHPIKHGLLPEVIRLKGQAVQLGRWCGCRWLRSIPEGHDHPVLASDEWLGRVLELNNSKFGDRLRLTKMEVETTLSVEECSPPRVRFHFHVSEAEGISHLDVLTVTGKRLLRSMSS